MIKQLSKKLGDFIFAQFSDELDRQGHKLTGNLTNSFETKVREKADSITIEFLMLNYGLSLNDGIKPNKIPYTIGGPPRGGTSKYIQGLIAFAVKKFGATKKRAKNIAFAIANKQKKLGYPLTGKIGFIDNVLDADSDEIEMIIQTYFEASIELMIKEYIDFKQK